jgi:hypothetical protein
MAKPFALAGLCAVVLISGRFLRGQEVVAQVNASSQDASVSGVVAAGVTSNQVSPNVDMGVSQGNVYGGGVPSSSELLFSGLENQNSTPGHWGSLPPRSRRHSGNSLGNSSDNEILGIASEDFNSSSQNKVQNKVSRIERGQASPSPGTAGTFPDTTQGFYWPTPPLNAGGLHFFNVSGLAWNADFARKHLVLSYRVSSKAPAGQSHNSKWPTTTVGASNAHNLDSFLNEDVSSGLNTTFGLEDSSPSLQGPLEIISSDSSDSAKLGN